MYFFAEVDVESLICENYRMGSNTHEFTYLEHDKNIILEILIVEHKYIRSLSPVSLGNIILSPWMHILRANINFCFNLLGAVGVHDVDRSLFCVPWLLAVWHTFDCFCDG